MSEVLLIRLGSQARDIVPWMIWSETEQEIIAAGEIGGALELAQLTEHAVGREVRVLVPTSDITLKTIGLPGKFNRQLQTALPYMLEDDLAQDVDALFFAIGDKTTLKDKPAINVAIVARQLMTQWLDWLKAAHIPCKMMIPDVLCLPLHEQGVSGIEMHNQWLVRSGPWAGISIDSVWFDDYLKLSANQFAVKQPQDSGEKFSFNSYSPCTASADNLDVVAQEAELPLKLLVKQAQSNEFSLLQGEFQIKKEGSKVWETWKQVAVIAAVAVVLQLGVRGTAAWQLSSQLDVQKTQFVSQFKQAFPGDKTKEGLIKIQLEKRLKAINASAGGNSGFLAMLEQVGPLLADNKGFVPNSFRYDGKRSELRLQATGDGFQSFEKFKSAVEKLGFTVQQGSLSNDGDKVAGTVTIKRAG